MEFFFSKEKDEPEEDIFIPLEAEEFNKNSEAPIEERLFPKFNSGTEIPQDKRDEKEKKSEKDEKEKEIDVERLKDEIIKEAKKRAEMLEREGYEKGFTQGEKDGYEIGIKKAKQIINRLNNLLNEMEGFKREIIKRFEKEILDLIFEISKKIINFKIENDPDSINYTILKTIKYCTDEYKIKIKINPEDYEIIKKFNINYITDKQDNRKIELIADEDVDRGGCIISTSSGDLDARIKSQLDQIHRALVDTYNRVWNKDA